jgi:hypothetical protein
VFRCLVSDIIDNILLLAAVFHRTTWLIIYNDVAKTGSKYEFAAQSRGRGDSFYPSEGTF